MSSKDPRQPSRRQFLRAGGTAAAVFALGRLPLTAQTAIPQTRHPMKIGVIGSGQQGGKIGLLWAKAGHEVLFSSRHPEELKDLVTRAGAKARAGLPEEAAKFGDVVLVAVPYGAVPQVGRDYAALMKGKVVIELGNPRADRDGPMANDALKKGVGLATAEYIPGVRLVRAFNALSSTQLDRDAHRSGERLGIPVAGDDSAAVATVVGLVEDAGFDPVVVGNLARAKEFDRDTSVYVKGMTARQIRETLKLPPKS
jgi:predicted dinucleotide-binding enzyme